MPPGNVRGDLARTHDRRYRVIAPLVALNILLHHEAPTMHIKRRAARLALCMCSKRYRDLWDPLAKELARSEPPVEIDSPVSYMHERSPRRLAGTDCAGKSYPELFAEEHWTEMRATLPKLVDKLAKAVEQRIGEMLRGLEADAGPPKAGAPSAGPGSGR